jgi:hypothetical protein
MIVAEVRANDDQRFGSIPEFLDDRRDFSGRRIASDNGHDLGRRRNVLQKGQLSKIKGTPYCLARSILTAP